MVRLCRDAALHGIRTHHALKALHLDDLFGSRVGGCIPGAMVERLEPRFPATRVWNAHRKLGPGVAYEAMDECLELASTYGVGLVSVDEAWHYLWGGAYALVAARRGYIGYTQCTAMLAEVVPFGGRRPTLGTNPHTWAFPTQEVVGFPVLVDFATSAVAMGRVQQCAREGQALQPGWAVDGTGSPTIDPAQAAALLPVGGHKGFGLGLIDEIMAAMIGGALPTLRGLFGAGTALESKRTPCFHFMAIHPEAVSGGRYEAGVDWRENLRRVLADIRGPGNEDVILPGQREAEAASECARAGGLLFTDAEMDGFDAVARECGVIPWDRALLARVDVVGRRGFA